MLTEVITLKETTLTTKNYFYLVFDSFSHTAVAIDPAGCMDRFSSTLESRGLNLKAVFITHTHSDHIGLAGLLKEKYGCRILVSDKEDLRCFNNIDDIDLIKNDIPIQIDTLTIEPIFTPGHTLGSTCFKIEDNLFTGDTLFIEGCGACFGDNSDPKLLYSSLIKLKHKIPHSTKIYPGHSFGDKPGRTFDFLLSNNIYLNFNREEQFVSFRMRDNQKRLMDFH